MSKSSDDGEVKKSKSNSPPNKSNSPPAEGKKSSSPPSKSSSNEGVKRKSSPPAKSGSNEKFKSKGSPPSKSDDGGGKRKPGSPPTETKKSSSPKSGSDDGGKKGSPPKAKESGKSQKAQTSTKASSSKSKPKDSDIGGQSISPPSDIDKSSKSKTSIKSEKRPPPPPPPPPPTRPPPAKVPKSKVGGAATPNTGVPSAATGGPRPPRRKRNEIVKVGTARIGFIGAGKIAEAIVKGLVHYSKVHPQCIYVSSKSGQSLDHFKQIGTVTTKRPYDIFGKFDCDVIFLVTHGYVVKACYQTGGSRPMALTVNYIPNQRHAQYILSLAGGITTNEIKNTLLNPEKPEKYKMSLNRIMLNQCVAFGNGVCGIDVEPDSKKYFPLVRDVISPMAPQIEYVPENQIDQVCAVAGNGLAFVYYFLSALADGGFKMGLSKQVAISFAAKTMNAAGTSLMESGKHAGDLRDSCVSPSGPAIYGIHLLDKQDCASGIASAVDAAYKRIKELSTKPPQ
ncbi:hypothetical protein RDWZM_000499 [Blomia tropicalis]|uniref:Pyrroline-5-carboxylate reductase 3 n=1 Tax=Blomia tropicalis TaxID=40697 RepID=A0A9Q0MAG1_BLOTA|nr:hypothetical protein RDWZM_000499 [Blomia tropicalis]